MELNKKLEVFILTYNRLNYLKLALESLFNQTVNNIKITVVDNASNDRTKEYIELLQKSHNNLNYYRQKENIGVLNNFLSVRNLAQAEYTYIPHDDDIVHPQYIEAILKVLDSEQNVDLIYSQKKDFYKDCEIVNYNYEKINLKIFNNKNLFTACQFIHQTGYTIPFPTVVYKTENIKQTEANILTLKSGAIADLTYVIDSLKNGKCILINEKMLNYRLHKNQDSVRRKMHVSEIISHNKFFKQKLNNNLYEQIIFNVFTYYWFTKTIKFYGCYENISIKDIAKQALKEQAITLYSYLLFSSFGIFIRPINYLIKKFLQKVKFIYKTLYLGEDL